MAARKNNNAEKQDKLTKRVLAEVGNFMQEDDKGQRFLRFVRIVSWHDNIKGTDTEPALVVEADPDPMSKRRAIAKVPLYLAEHYLPYLQDHVESDKAAQARAKGRKSA